MKKIAFILIFVLIRCNVFAFNPLFVCSGAVESGGADYSDIVAHWNFENSLTLDKGGVTGTAQNSPSFTTDYSLTGSYSGTASGLWNNWYFSITDNDICPRTSGRIGIWIRTPSTLVDDDGYYEVYWSDDDRIRLRNYHTTGLEVLYRGQATTYQYYKESIIATDTAYYIEVAWDESTDTVAVYIDGVEETGFTTAGTFTDTNTDNSGVLYVGGLYIQGMGGAYIDQLIISTDKTRDLYSIRNVTDFN